ARTKIVIPDGNIAKVCRVLFGAGITTTQGNDMLKFIAAGIYGLVSLLLLSQNAFAHGIIGARFFPATMTIDDPFVADEMSLPTISTLKSSDDPSVRETDYSEDISKRLSRNLGIGAGATYKYF